MEDFDYNGTYRVTVVLDNGIVIEPLYFCNDGYKAVDEMEQWLNSVGRKVLVESTSLCGSAFTLVFGKGEDGMCFRVSVLPDMIRRC